MSCPSGFRHLERIPLDTCIFNGRLREFTSIAIRRDKTVFDFNGGDLKLITIDGPSASGKTSVSRQVAAQLGWEWVSTGAFYRGLGYAAFREGLSTGDEKGLVDLIASNIWSVEMSPANTRVVYKGQDVTAELHQEKVAEWASIVSQLPRVRERLLQPQRDCLLKAKNGLIAEGRDCGTVVFPEAGLKIYLTADEERRISRRATEEGVESESLKKVQQARDARDLTRKHAPLQTASDSIVIDTTEMTLDEVAAKILKIAEMSLT